MRKKWKILTNGHNPTQGQRNLKQNIVISVRSAQINTLKIIVKRSLSWYDRENPTLRLLARINRFSIKSGDSNQKCRRSLYFFHRQIVISSQLLIRYGCTMNFLDILLMPNRFEGQSSSYMRSLFGLFWRATISPIDAIELDTWTAILDNRNWFYWKGQWYVVENIGNENFDFK